ncbi:hypothetical protein EVAR_18461_1 [Eumeta japonica]|uniref:Uncharacterized protein n=1 Tax=Eumeta variegata TaxID=151549 RepID=A0A4C1V102_EUMVA|nr:hypothetical protein EVAR_18461_1 [Eumeta japonica]
MTCTRDVTGAPTTLSDRECVEATAPRVRWRGLARPQRLPYTLTNHVDFSKSTRARAQYAHPQHSHQQNLPIVMELRESTPRILIQVTIATHHSHGAALALYKPLALVSITSLLSAHDRTKSEDVFREYT